MKSGLILNDYLSQGKDILKILASSGEEAYFVGDAVRNMLLKKKIKSVTIVTSAAKDKLKAIFKDNKIEELKNGNLKLRYVDYDFILQILNVKADDLVDLPYDEQFSKKIVYDLMHRSYTIDALALSYNGQLVDVTSGYQDLKRKKICHIGLASKRFKENPAMMLEGIALVAEYKFKLKQKTKKAINKYSRHLADIKPGSYFDILKEIFSAPYANKALSLLIKTNLYKYIPDLKKPVERIIDLHQPVSLKEALLMGFLFAGKINPLYEDCFSPDEHVSALFYLAKNYRSGRYKSHILYQYGNDLCIEANRINSLAGLSVNKAKKIQHDWEKLPVRSINNLCFGEEDLKKIIDPSGYSFTKEILNFAAREIIAGKLKNEYDDIKAYVLSILPKYHIELKKEEEKEDKMPEKAPGADPSFPLTMEIAAKRLDILEEKVQQQSRLLMEKDIRMQELEYRRLSRDTTNLINQALASLQESENLKFFINDNEDFKEKLTDFIYTYVDGRKGNHNVKDS